MDFRFTPQQEELRREVRAFLEAERKQGTYETDIDAWIEGWSPEMSKKIGQKGWIGVTWPTQYGGRGWTYMDRLIITEELLRYGAPVQAQWPGDRQIGPSLIKYGTEEQRKEFLPKIIKGEIAFALGMSEPEAGSDLAGLKIRAMGKDGDFLFNGQKVWTGGAHKADYIYIVARTDPDAPKHKGISEFIVDLRSPGVTVKPLVDITGRTHLNEVYFDNARVPRSGLIGQINRGWYQIIAQLDYERSGLERVMSNYPLFEAIQDYTRKTTRNGKPLSEDPVIRNNLAELRVEYEVGRWLIYRIAWMLTQGKLPNYEAAESKIFGTAYQQRLAAEAMRILGLSGQLVEDSPRAPLKGWAARSTMFSLAYTIMGGTSEILRNVVAGRGLGMPSE
ncbi:MAG: acyl-CoA dehydrogenase family protein [Chloroflexi bacterium]|nr:acyl-CoA dehydrogenase family protein [Chloroflexota bacterium]